MEGATPPNDPHSSWPQPTLPAGSKTGGRPQAEAAAAAGDPQVAPLLDPIQTSVKNLPQASACVIPPRLEFTQEWKPEEDSTQSFVHSGWSITRRRVRDSLVRTEQSSERVFRFQECGSSAWVYESVARPAEFMVLTNHCGDRLCVPCSQVKARKIAAAVAEQCEDKPRMRFITLTLANTKAGLAEALDRLYRHFRALRATDLWRDHVEGGAAFLEIKYSDKSRRWHPHFHIMAEGRFLRQQDLQEMWHAITKDSYIVDIRACSTNEQAASYAAKYAGKPMVQTFSGTPSLIDEAVHALRGRRLFFCFGSWYGTSLSAFDGEGLFDDEADSSWTSVGSFREIAHAAAQGDERSAFIISRLRAVAATRPKLESG